MVHERTTLHQSRTIPSLCRRPQSTNIVSPFARTHVAHEYVHASHTQLTRIAHAHTWRSSRTSLTLTFAAHACQHVSTPLDKDQLARFHTSRSSFHTVISTALWSLDQVVFDAWLQRHHEPFFKARRGCNRRSSVTFATFIQSIILHCTFINNICSTCYFICTHNCNPKSHPLSLVFSLYILTTLFTTFSFK